MPINRTAIQTSDLTGSLLRIKEPVESYVNSYRKQNFGDNPIHTDKNITSTTASFENIVEPTIVESKKLSSIDKGLTILNTKDTISKYRKQIFDYSARVVEKQITAFDETTNTLYIDNVQLDYGTEMVTNDNFELFYNGMIVPFIYDVKQIGTTVEIIFSEEYIRYESLTLPQIFAVGKFK